MVERLDIALPKIPLVGGYAGKGEDENEEEDQQR